MGIFNEDVEVQEITVGKIDDEQKYLSSFRAEGIADDASRAVWFENPTGSGEDQFVVVVTPAPVPPPSLSSPKMFHRTGRATP